MARIRLLVSLMLTAGLLTASSAHSASSGAVVSQVYAGGGNTGASYTNDFVELFNPGTAAIDLTGWTLQYASAAATTWQATALSGSIPSGRYYLVQLASAAAIGAPLPTPDAAGTTNLAVSGGKVALVRGTAALACGASPGSCSSNPLLADLLGYGSATDYEGAGAATALSSTTAAVRAAGGCTDSGDNSADFSATAPTPRNTSTPALHCSGPPPPSAGASQGAAVDSAAGRRWRSRSRRPPTCSSARPQRRAPAPEMSGRRALASQRLSRPLPPAGTTRPSRSR